MVPMGPSPVHTGHQIHANQPAANANQSSLSIQSSGNNKTGGAVSTLLTVNITYLKNFIIVLFYKKRF